MTASKTQAKPMHVVFIFDRSGSMSGHEQDVIGGFNTYVEELKKEAGDVGVTYVRFDTEVERVWIDLELADVPFMTPANYQPRGGTALYDAVGQTIAALKDKPGHTFVIITHTDGEENSSHEWTQEKVKALVTERTALGNWTFLFFGQGFDKWHAEVGSQGMAMAGGNTVAYNHGAGKIMMATAGRVSNVMRGANLSGTQTYNVAMDAALAGASDVEIEQILKGEKADELFDNSSAEG